MAPPLSPLLALLLLLLTTASTTAEPLYQFCSSTAGNYTAKSTFETNLKSLLTSLSANGSATGFFNDTTGDIPDRIYGLVLCRGDDTRGQCRSCLATASQDVLQICTYRRTAVIWYDECMLRYSNQMFFSALADSNKFYMWNTANVTSELARFNGQLRRLMDGLVRYAAYNASAPRLFATGTADYAPPESPKIYGLVQCSRDLSADDCALCLREVVSDIPNLTAGKRGGRVIKATCNQRYELYSFYNSSVMVSVPLPLNATPPTAPLLNPPVAAPTGEGKKKNGTGTVLAIAIPVGVALVLISVICICFWRRKVKRKMYYGADAEEIITIESLLFDLSTLRTATGNFSDLNKLGEGGFGAVYKGLLPNGQEIAVKRLSTSSGQGLGELKNEVVLLAKLQHRNLVRLLGVCLEEEEKILVYEYMPNTSLDTFLFDPVKREQLYWERRYKIIGGIARGLMYLHEDSQVKIIHRDLKASNILLDADMNPKISDFGLARLFGGDQTQASTTRVVGTYGYMAPEYAMRGHFSNKSDVFSYGVLVLEIITGRKNNDYSDSERSADLLGYVWEHWNNGTVTEVIDPSLGGQCPRSEVMRCIQIGLLCVQEAAFDRPTMSSIVLILNSYSVSLQVPSRPAFFAGFSRIDSDVLQKNLDSSGNTADRTTTKSSTQYSVNEVSITELDPR